MNPDGSIEDMGSGEEPQTRQIPVDKLDSAAAAADDSQPHMVTRGHTRPEESGMMNDGNDFLTSNVLQLF